MTVILVAFFGVIASFGVAQAGVTQDDFSSSPITVDGTDTPIAGDFDGDGHTDIFWYAPGPAPESVWTSDGAGAFSASPTMPVVGTYTPIAGDFDGDGLTDIFWYAPGPAADWLWTNLGDGVFSSSLMSVVGTYTPIAGDFDGDGLTDIFWYAAGPAADWLWTSAGDGVFSTSLMSVLGTYTPVPGHFDGDARTDILWYAPGPAADWLWLSVPAPEPDYDNEVTVPLHWQNQYRVDDGQFGGVDDYAAFHLDPEGTGEITFKWNDGATTVVIDGETDLTARATSLTVHVGGLRDEVAAAATLPAPTFAGSPADAPDDGDRGLYTYSLDGTVADATDLIQVLEAGLGYISIQTVANEDGEVRGQLGFTDGGLAGIVPVYKHLEFHEEGVGTNTGTPQTGFNLLFDANIDYPEATQDWPDPEDFVLTLKRGDAEPVELPILRVRGNNDEWQPYPKPDMRLQLDGHGVIEDGDIVTIEMLDSGAAKLLPEGRNSAAGDLMESTRIRCTHVLSVRAMTSEPCGTPPLPGLVDDLQASAIDTAPNQTQQFSVTIEQPGIPAGEELWVNLVDVSHDGLVDYSGSTWTATVDGQIVGTAEFWELMIVERFETVWEPFLVFTPTGTTPVAGELVLSGTGIDGSDAAVYGVDSFYDTYAVRRDTGRAVYGTIGVLYEAQPTITLEPADSVVLAEVGAQVEMTATYTEADGVTPVQGADLQFRAAKGERPDIVEVDLGGPVTTDENGKATVTYTYDARTVAVGAPLIDTVSVEDTADTFVDAETTVTWAAGVATNTGSAETFHDLNAAVIAAEAGDTITAEGEFTSEYGTPRDDRIEVRKSLTLLGNGEASLVGAFDLRANEIELSGFDITRGAGKEFAVRTEGAGIVVTGNVIDATGMNGVNVRDAWSPVPGGGSATITGNEIGNAAIGIHADVDKMKAGEPVPFVMVVDLVVTGNTFTDNGTAIYYSPDPGSTAVISGNLFEAGDVTNVYVDDATVVEDNMPLDLEAILAGNVYDPLGEIIGTKIVPIDPTHEPSMVRVVEHGAGTGNMYSIIEYTRGVACADAPAAVGSQFTLDRGEEQTPNRVGIDVECNYDGNPSLIKVEWDGNPSFPNAITYTEHLDPAYRIHNEHPLDGGGFTEALSPQTVGSPFPKPEDGAAVFGAVYFQVADATIDGRWFTPDQAISAVDLRVSVAERSEDRSLSLRLEGARPGEVDFIAGDTICTELFTAESCTVITQALLANDGFMDNTDFLTDATLQVASDAAVGIWQLRWSVVDTATSESYFSDTFRVTILSNR